MKFSKRFFSLYILFVLQNVVTLSVNLTDNMMIGAYSEIALSGVAAINQVQFFYQQILNALSEGVVMISSQYWGTGRIEPIKKVVAIAIKITLGVALLLFTAVSLFPEQVMRIFTTSPAIINQGIDYLMIVRFSYFFLAITMILLASLRSVEIVKIGFQLSIIAFFLNICINYTLIFGKFGAPEMGAQGAAVGTLIARIVELLLLIIYLKLRDKTLQSKLKDYLTFDSVLRKDYFRLVVPMVGISGLWGLSTGLQTSILGYMSSAAIAANSVASVLFLLVKGGAVGAASAGAIIIGKEIGSGNLEQVIAYSKKLQKMFFAIGVVGGIVLFFIRIPILGLYDLSPETQEMANQFLIILSVIYVGMGYQMPTSEGIIRGGGNPMFIIKMNLICSWMIVIPLSYMLAFYFKASPAVVVFALNSDQLFKCVPVFLKANFGKWIYKLTREEA
ncbi:MATE family efflux transporter [Enterococcus sp. 669A]|uniref:MATE family efflux transporter n=1 Tax=Candidatus Enterococcus moelleringii TaxID=2815325 RepID=A0ABS3L7Y2_9ENTE|nr:MATE family efflux transporter [Enterococcus sp. 669A]MBO1305728.1 MATE family efflux transporter [Enterococcus sp. 669A]